MNVWKRGFLAIYRRPVRSMLLVILLYCIICLVIIGVSASYTSANAQIEAKNQVGVSLLLTLNMEDYEKRIQELVEQGYDLGSMPEPPASQIEIYSPPNFEFITIFLEDIEKLAHVEGIKDYNIESMMNTVMKAVDFKRLEGTFSDETDLPEVTLRSVRDLSLMSIVQDGSITLKKGRWIQADDVGRLVVSEALAELNQLQLGDTLTLETVPMKDTLMLEVMKRFGFEEPETIQIEGEIVGVFQNNRSIAYNPGVISQRSENQIFSDLDFAKVGVHKDDPFYEQVNFYVDDVANLEQIKMKLKDVDINWDRYELFENKQALDELTPAFEQVKELGILILVVVLISSFAILSLTFIFLIRGRSQEIGVWLSLGKTKKMIVLQILWENLLMAFIALLICGITKPIIVKGAEQYFNNQGVVQAETHEEPFMEEQLANLEDTGEREKIILTVTSSTVVMAAGMCIFLLSTTTILALVPIFKLKPREILTRLA